MLISNKRKRKMAIKELTKVEGIMKNLICDAMDNDKIYSKEYKDFLMNTGSNVVVTVSKLYIENGLDLAKH